MAEKFQYKQGTDSTAGANVTTHFYDRAGINAANVKNIYGQFADRKSMPLKYGKEYKISRWQHSFDRKLADADFQKYGFISSRSLDDITNQLTNVTLEEGAGRKNLVDFQKVTLSTKFARYGEEIEYTDEVEMFSEDHIQVRFREELGELANLRMEDLIQKDMLGTNNILYSGLGTDLGSMGNGIVADGSLDDQYRVSYDFIRKAVRKLVRNRAKKNTQIVTGSTKIDTKTINSAFYAIIGPEVKSDLENLIRTGGNLSEFVYIPVYKYADASKIAEGEVGCMHEVRFIESDTAMVYRGKGKDVPENYTGKLSYTGTIGSGAKFDVFPILFPTQGAFATVGLKGHNKITFRSLSPDHNALENPYGTTGYFSYNFWYAGIILQEEKLLKGLVLASS